MNCCQFFEYILKECLGFRKGGAVGIIARVCYYPMLTLAKNAFLKCSFISTENSFLLVIFVHTLACLRWTILLSED